MYKRRETIVARWYSCTIHGTETMATRHAESRSFVQKCVFLAFLFAIQVAGGGEESVYEKLVGGSFDFANLFTRYFSFRRRSVEILCKIFWFASNIFTNLNVKRSSAMDTYPMEAIFIFNTFFLDTIENYNYYHYNSENREIIIKLFYHNELSLHLYIFSFR